MKQSIYLFLFITTLGISCNNDTYNLTRSVAVIIDVTESSTDRDLNSDLIVKDIMEILDLNDNYYGKATISIHLLNELSGKRPVVIELPRDNSGNSIIRKEKIKKFLNNAQASIRDVLGSKKEQKFSKIYSKLCHIIHKYQRKEVTYLIYSDLLENSQLASFYKSSTLDKAVQNPVDFVKNKFRSTCEISSLENQSVIIYTIRSTETDRMVQKSLNFWGNFLRHKGAKVYINPI